MSCVDLIFPVTGRSLPRQYQYDLYSAVCRLVPSFHDDRRIGIFPISGEPLDSKRISLTDRSVLRLRLPQDRIRDALVLAGKRLDISREGMRVGVPQVRVLPPSDVLYSPFVYIKLAALDSSGLTVDSFLTATRKKLVSQVDDRLGHLGLSDSIKPTVPVVESGSHKGEPKRRVLRIKNYTLVGYALRVEGLSSEESVLLQEQGLGGKRRMGCGLFTPIKRDACDG